ncbi:MAG: DNA polymerase III subunit chi [Pseudomonadota bacterium]
MAEVRFYHLTDSPLERTLPVMLERTLARGNHAVVRGGHAERLKFLDAQLWTFADESFLPHGIDGDPSPERQPIWLTETSDRPNGARTLFLIDGSAPDFAEIADLDLTAILFDGHDPAAVEQARGHWKATVAAGLKAVYWAQEAGRWVQKAQSGGAS